MTVSSSSRVEREREREQGWVLSFLGTQREKIEDIQANI